MADYPLANKTGLAMLCLILSADDLWSKATKPQKRLIRDLCADIMPAIDKARESEEPKVRLGTTPKVEAAEPTLASMRRKGLVDDRGWLTMNAIEACYWIDHRRNGDGNG